MTRSLVAFQDAFAQALLAPPTVAGGNAVIDRLTAQPGFAVYRNTVAKGCIDALQANYPAVVRLVGDEWFRAAAAVFMRESLPRHPTLLDYGAGFAEFLLSFAPAAELPYLADVARLDRLWSEAHVAADSPLLDAAALADLGSSRMRQAKLVPHPAARWRWFGEAPIHSIWSRSRAGDGTIGDLEWRGEGALLSRPFGEVRQWSLDRAGVAFLDSCAGGARIHDAVLAALAVDGRADLAALIGQLLAAGAFTAIDRREREESRR